MLAGGQIPQPPARRPAGTAPPGGRAITTSSTNRASIFNIADGEPLLPLQILWVAFTTVTIQSIGLGSSKPAAGLMERPPRPSSQPILMGVVTFSLLNLFLRSCRRSRQS